MDFPLQNLVSTFLAFVKRTGFANDFTVGMHRRAACVAGISCDIFSETIDQIWCFYVMSGNWQYVEQLA